MSANEKQQPPVPPTAQEGQQPYFPPPPPGPPPGAAPGAAPIQTSQTVHPPKHPNEVPLPDYDIPTYNPAHPQYAPPLGAAADDDIYNASPVDAHPPKWGFHHHESGDDSEGGKKKHRLSGLGAAFTSKVAGPVNALANKLGSEGFLPESLDKECEKAARILRGFCKDGIYSDALPPTAIPTPPPSTATTTTKPPPSPNTKPAKKPRVLLTIPPKVIARARGLAIFTAVRLGYAAAGSSGSGVLVARLPDGSWSPPSGIRIASIGGGFVAGVDIYDCVVVINTPEALDLFTRTRLSLGSDLAVTAGPFGAGGALEWGVPSPGGEKAPPLPPRPVSRSGLAPLSADNTHFQTGGNVPEDQQGMGADEEDAKDKAKRARRPSPFRQAAAKPVYSYVKSRGLFAGVQIDGTVIAEREGANAKFYGAAVPVAKILRGEVPAHGPEGMWPAAARGLIEVLKGAEASAGAGPAPVSPGFGAPVGASGVGAPQSSWVPPPAEGVPSPAPGTSAASHAVPPPTQSFPPPPAQAFPPPPTQAFPPPPTQETIPSVTTGLRSLNVSDNTAAGPSTTTTTASSAKAAEAAAEAARHAAENSPPPPPPPSYAEHHDHQSGATGGEDLPPAYVEDERSRPVGDGKTGLH